MANEYIFLIHCLLMGFGALGSLFLGAYALITFICLQLIASNLFVIKPVVLFGITATGADAFTIGAVCGFHLLQEFYGRDIAQKTIIISFSCLILFVAAGQIHLWYLPALSDQSHAHFAHILSVLPRITLASLSSYVITQQFDCWLFDKVRRAFAHRYLPMRNALCASLSQLFDTCLFSILGLWGIVDPLHEIILISYAIKLIALGLMTPCIILARALFKTRPIGNIQDSMVS